MSEQDESSGTAGSRNAQDAPGQRETSPEELERQAREAIETVRASAGELGARVRDVMQRASSTWQATSPVGDTTEPDESTVDPAQEMRARALARRWVASDFLIEPELSRYMGVTAVDEGALWRIELRERGETRSFGEVLEPYQGIAPQGPGPLQPVWDYAFPVPDVMSGERRERLEGSGMLGACAACSGSGHQRCTHCEGNGFVTCAACHGRSRISCRRCRGRGRIADPAAERRARANHTYWQVQAERFANDAAARLADFSERLRQEHGVPLPPAAQWVPVAPASGETIPCPECANGTVPCAECREGKQTCPECQGSAYSVCTVCSGSGRAIRYREVVRRFDTRASERLLTASDEVAHWLGGQEPHRVGGEVVWEGASNALPEATPSEIPAEVWAEARTLARQAESALSTVPTGGASGAGPERAVAGERRILERQVRVLRVPVTHVEYTFATHPFAFSAVGVAPSERFVAESFPPRWHRIGRFLRALTRDLSNEHREGARSPSTEEGDVSSLAEYRMRRMHSSAHRVRIIADESPASTDPAPESGSPVED